MAMSAVASRRLEELEERVYGDMVSAARALAVPEAQRERLADAAVAVLVDAQRALEAGGGEAAVADASARLDVLAAEMALLD